MLFSADNIRRESDNVSRIIPGGKTSDGVSSGKMKEFLPELQHDHSYHYVNKARWSTHDLLQYYLLPLTGPAKVWMTTWSITTGPATILVDLLRTGLITDLSAIISSRLRVTCPNALQMLMLSEARIALAELHAKVLVIQNDTWSISVVGSQNWSNIKRIEAGVIDTSAQVAAGHIQWIEHELVNQPKP